MSIVDQSKELELAQDNILHQQDIIQRGRQWQTNICHVINQETDEVNMKQHLDRLFQVKVFVDTHEQIPDISTIFNVSTLEKANYVKIYGVSKWAEIGETTVNGAIVYLNDDDIYKIYVAKGAIRTKKIMTISDNVKMLNFDSSGRWINFPDAQAHRLISLNGELVAEFTTDLTPFIYRGPYQVFYIKTPENVKHIVVKQPRTFAVFRLNNGVLTHLWSREEIQSDLALFPSGILFYREPILKAYTFDYKRIFELPVDTNDLKVRVLSSNINDGRLHILAQGVIDESIQYLVYDLTGRLTTKRLIANNEFVDILERYNRDTQYYYQLTVNPDNGATYIFCSPRLSYCTFT